MQPNAFVASVEQAKGRTPVLANLCEFWALFKDRGLHSAAEEVLTHW